MSRARPPNPLRTWGSLNPLFTSRCPHLRPAPALRNKHNYPTQYHGLNRHHKPFHTSAGLNAARSPATRRSQNVRSQPSFSSDGLLSVSVRGDLDTRLKLLHKKGPEVLAELQLQGMLDKSIEAKTFMQVARDILRAAYTEAPSVASVRRIYYDLDTTFTIGHAISVSLADPPFRQWVLSACAQAGARVAVLITAARYIHRSKESGSAPVRTMLLSQVETFAIQERDPRAMLVHAKVLGLRGRYDEALALVQEIMGMIEPSQTALSGGDNLLVASVESPWEIYLWLRGLHAGKQKGKNTDQWMGEDEETVIRGGALEYQDPVALVRYAGLMMQRGDFAAYEECMGKAATAGNAEACRKLGNFYYLTFLGRYPRLGKKGKPVVEGEINKDTPVSGPSTGFISLLLSFFSARPIHEYQALAMEWYRLGAAHGCTKSDIILSILSWEGRDPAGAGTLDAALLNTGRDSRELGSFVRQLKSRWLDKEYKPEIPEILLDI